MNKRSAPQINITWIILILLALGIGALAKITYFKYQEYKLAKIRMEMQANILEGATVQPLKVTVDYSKQIAEGSPLTFGAGQYPDITHTNAWNEISDAGITMVRKDLFINYEVPSTTLEDYRNNVKDIQNTNTWRKNHIDNVNTVYKNAKDRGMKVMAIVSYNPRWLTFSGDEFGVPKDWDIYEDLVAKSYKLHRQYIDYIELWNEPTYKYFINVKNSTMTPVEAYTQLFLHGVKAIHKVDQEANDGKQVVIGGFVAHKPDETAFLDTFLANEEVRKNLNFISYHNYEHRPEPSWDLYKPILSKYGLDNMPIFLTEWNYTPEEKKPSDYLTGNKAISYTGSKLINFLNMGLAGANYYSLFPLEENSKTSGHGYLAFYKWMNNKVELLPQAKTWRLMSKTLALGAGKSKITETTNDEKVTASGAINIHGDKEVVLSNPSSTPQLLELDLSKLNIRKRAVIYIYLASKDNDATKPVRNELAEIKNNGIKTRFYMPEESVAGVVVKQFSDSWFDLFDAITHKN